MTDLYRTRAIWSGFPGGPGVSTFYGLGSGLLVPNIRALMLAVSGILPTDVTIQVENTGDILDDATGALTGSWTSSPVLSVHGLQAGAYAAPSGVCMDWLTTTIADGHRLKGRTFFVPCSSVAYQNDGSIDPTQLATLITQAATFMAAASGDLVVWHRPRVAAAATAWHPAVTARAGSNGLVTGSGVPDKVVVLRSRRD